MTDIVELGTPFLGRGSYFEVKNAAEGVWHVIDGMTSFNYPGISKAEVDASTMLSKAKFYLVDIVDNGTVTGEMNFMPGTPAQRLLWESLNSGEILDFRCTLPDDGEKNGPAVLSYSGFVQALPFSGDGPSAVKANLTVRLSGNIALTLPERVVAITLSPQTLTPPETGLGEVLGVVTVSAIGVEFSDPLVGVSFSGVPNGLTGVVTRVNKDTAKITFTGNADVYDVGTESTVVLTFASSAFVGKLASDVVGSSGQAISIKFM